MSNEMIERVAVAICLNVECYSPALKNTVCPLLCDECLQQARAAVEAMRKPTEDMVEAGVAAWLKEDTPTLGNEAVITMIHHAVIDEALK